MVPSMQSSPTFRYWALSQLGWICMIVLVSIHSAVCLPVKETSEPFLPKETALTFLQPEARSRRAALPNAFAGDLKDGWKELFILAKRHQGDHFGRMALIGSRDELTQMEDVPEDQIQEDVDEDSRFGMRLGVIPEGSQSMFGRRLRENKGVHGYKFVTIPADLMPNTPSGNRKQMSKLLKLVLSHLLNTPEVNYEEMLQLMKKKEDATDEQNDVEEDVLDDKTQSSVTQRKPHRPDKKKRNYRKRYICVKNICFIPE